MICTCPLCNRRIAASLPLFGTVQKCLGCGAKIRIPGDEGGPAELVEKWLGGEGVVAAEAKATAPEAVPSAWAPMVAATGAGQVVALPSVPAAAVPEMPSTPAEEYRRPSPLDPLPPAPSQRPVVVAQRVAMRPSPPAPTTYSTTAELEARGDTEAITRPVRIRMHPLYRNLAALAGLVVLGVVIAIVVVWIRAAKRSPADSGQDAALKFNDALAEADTDVHASCADFVQSVERWLDGQALEPVAIMRSHDATMRRADEYTVKVGSMKAPDSDEARALHRKAMDLAEAYKDLTNVAFSEVVRRVGEGGSPGAADFDRVELLVALGDSKIQAGQKALIQAQQIFAKKHAILLAPKK